MCSLGKLCSVRSMLASGQHSGGEKMGERMNTTNTRKRGQGVEDLGLARQKSQEPEECRRRT